MTSRLRTVAVVAVLTVSSAVVAPHAAVAATAHIAINNFGYSGDMHVHPGELVRVVNHDAVHHTLTDKRTHRFDTGTIAANGGTGSFTAPMRLGRYPFGCRFHPEMSGTLFVEDASALSSSASATVRKGAAHSLGTRLTDTRTHAGLGLRHVVLQKRTARGFVAVKGATTSSDGRATTVVHPRTTTRYRWHFAGVLGHTATNSAITTLTVRR